MSPSVTVRLLGTQSDARLVELARNGHERAFEALVQRYRRPLLGYCRRVLLPEARAEDALQQALLQAWLALQRGDDVRDARAWLYRIVHNTALNALRSSGYDYAQLSEAITGAGAPQEDLDRRIAVREALAGLAALPEQQREALLRTAVEGASHAAAAAEMGLSESALRGLVYRARASLRTAVTAITPMPLASWAAGVAGHGAAGTVAELAVGGGSAGVAGLLAKGGMAMLAAGVLAAGVGTVATRHERPHARSHPARAVRAAATVPTRAVASAGGVAPAHDRGRTRRRPAALTPISFHRAPAVPVAPRDGGGRAPRQGTSGGGGDRGSLGGGTEPGEQEGSGRVPGSGAAGDDGGSGGGSAGSGVGGHDGGATGSDGGGDGSSSGGGSSSGDGGPSGGGTGSSGDSGSSGSGSDGGTSGSGTSSGGAGSGSGTTTTGGDG